MERSGLTIAHTVILVLILECLGVLSASGQDCPKLTKQAYGAWSGNPSGPFLINNVFSYYSGNGAGCTNPYSLQREGFEFPKGSGKTLVYNDGIFWGGYFNAEAKPRVGGSMYGGLIPGKILVAGTATTLPVRDDPNKASNRVYRIRKNVHPPLYPPKMVVRLDATELQYVSRYQALSSQDLFDQYDRDWKEWPGSDGAPFLDLDGDGAYIWAADFACVYGADQILWYVANDIDSLGFLSSLSSPMGIEVQKMIWGYNQPGALGNTIFSSTRIINKSGAPIDSMFLGQWVDPDVGNSQDDFTGCDTTLDMGFAYNGKSQDAMYGTAVPAIGYMILQGPRVPAGPTDSAIAGMRYYRGYRNLKMSAFLGTTCAQGPFSCPFASDQYYRSLKGLLPLGGPVYEFDDSTKPVTTFAFSGDPVTGTGWNEPVGTGFAGERYMIISTGPFSMAPGDTQEIVVASIAGDGADRLSSIAVLREYANEVRMFYHNLVTTLTDVGERRQSLPLTMSLDQNYPNPFNPSTTIAYRLPSASTVTLRIYNVFGQEVRLLLSGAARTSGEHEVQWDGTDNKYQPVASGVYFCRIETRNAQGDLPTTQVRKMLLLR